jgi:Zn finger protein HypA/HybF involved in hydrogenase expression
MLKILSYLFLPKNGKTSTDNFVAEDPVEKKKCKNCLRKVNLDYLRCPHCGGSGFYDS